jgi:hypothetical protein
MNQPEFSERLFPDYSGGGFLNLIASLAEACGAAPRHAPLAALAPEELRGARNVVLVIFDGLGERYLQANGSGGHLLRHRRTAISAVFPSTTAAAITTSFTGAAPLEHGLTGWFVYLREAGCVGAPLPFQRRGERSPLPVAAQGVFREASLFDSLQVPAVVVSHRDFIHSIYNRHHCGRAARRAYATLDGFVAETVAAVRSGPQRKFVYAYWPVFDTLAHKHGVASAEVRREFGAIDAAFGELLARLAGTDTMLVATADHGFVDSPPERSIELPAALGAMLRYPLCGERRVVFCHPQQGRAAEFGARAREALCERAEVRSSAELVEEGWFGPGEPHPLIAERVGEVALLMRERWTLKDWVAGEPRHLHIGNHGGTSADEMIIPLVVAKT